MVDAKLREVLLVLVSAEVLVRTHIERTTLAKREQTNIPLFHAI